MIEGRGAEIVDQVPDPVMWCFIDGCHCRSCVEAELAAYAPRVKPGGFLLLHDCTEEYRGYPPDQYYHGKPARAFEVLEVVEEWEKDHSEFIHVGTTPAQPIADGKFLGGTRVLRRKM
jgi:cephalosporin hydroxylase